MYGSYTAFYCRFSGRFPQPESFFCLRGPGRVPVKVALQVVLGYYDAELADGDFDFDVIASSRSVQRRHLPRWP